MDAVYARLEDAVPDGARAAQFVALEEREVVVPDLEEVPAPGALPAAVAHAAALADALGAATMCEQCLWEAKPRHSHRLRSGRTPTRTSYSPFASVPDGTSQRPPPR